MALTIDGTNGLSANSQMFLVGQVAFFAMANPPAGFVKCNGAALSRITYASLFNAIGTLYGAGNGTTTFNVPDLRGEFIRALDDNRGVDGGRTLGSWQGDLFGAHSHSSAYNGNGTNGLGGVYGYASGDYSARVGTLGSNLMDLAGGTETRPRNVALLACIYTGV